MSETKITDVTRVGIDIAKEVFQVHGVDINGKFCFSKKISRRKLIEFICQLPPCLIGMEACSGAHYWAKEFAKYGHSVKLIAAHRVKPYVSSGNKDDKIDAEAICEAVSRPKMKFVECKTYEQLEIQALHRHRQQLTKTINVLSNQIRGFLLEYGIAIPKGVQHVFKKVPLIIEDSENKLSTAMRDLVQVIFKDLKTTNQRISEVDKIIEKICKQNEICKRLSKIPGIGPITATALYAAIGNGRQFENGRETAAWLGIIPSHRGTGGKAFNGRLSKKGNRYIKTLAIQGGRSALNAAKKKKDSNSLYLQSLLDRKCNNLAAVACAHHNIRVAWALMARQEEYKVAV